MKHYTPPPVASEVIDALRARIKHGGTQAALIKEMRGAGHSLGESIKLVRVLYDVTLGEAKRIVHFSKAWADCRDRNETLHETVVSAAFDLGFHDADSIVREQRSETRR